MIILSVLSLVAIAAIVYLASTSTGVTNKAQPLRIRVEDEQPVRQRQRRRR